MNIYRSILTGVLLFTFSEKASCSSIKELNETEYDRFPPLISLNDYRRCLREDKDVYCFAKFTLDGEPGNQLLELIRDYSSNHYTRFNHSYIERGVCVTKSCIHHIGDRNLDDDEDVGDILELCVNESIYKSYGLQARMEKLYNCNRKADTNSEKDMSDWLVAGYCIAILVLVILGSVYDGVFYKNIKETNSYGGKQYLLCFSVFRNWQRLVHTSGEDENSSFQFLHGLRCIVAFFVIYIHSLFLFALLSDDSREYEMAYSSPFAIIFNGLPIVQVFFMMSGFLVVLWLIKKEETTRITWKLYPILLLGRWFRLAMPCLTVFGLSTTWFRYAGTGPLWNHMVIDIITTCRKYWWAHVLFVNNLIPEDAVCMYQTWTLATEMQLFVLSVALYLATRGRPKTRNILLAILVLLGLVIPSLNVYLGDYDASAIAIPEMYRTVVHVDTNKTFTYMHIKTYNNLLFYFIGMSLGYCFDYCNKNKNIYSWNKQLCNLLVWSLIPGLIAIFMTMPWFYEADVYSRAVYSAAYRVAMALLCLCAGWPMLMKWDDTGLRKFMEWRGWVLPSRLSYLVFLLHAGIIFQILGTSRQMVQFSFLNTLILQLAVVCISLLAALLLNLTVEGPMSALLKCFISSIDQQPIKKKIT